MMRLTVVGGVETSHCPGSFDSPQGTRDSTSLSSEAIADEMTRPRLFDMESRPMIPGIPTTASLLGHALRASDELRSPGTLIGKAMAALD